MWDYQSYLRKDIGPALGGLTLTGITGEHFAWWTQGLAEAGASGKTISNKHGFLSSALDAAVRAGRIPSNAALGQRLPASEREEMTCPSHEDFARLLDKVTDHWKPPPTRSNLAMSQTSTTNRRTSTKSHPARKRIPAVASFATIIREHGKPDTLRFIQDRSRCHRHGGSPVSTPGWYQDPSGRPGQRYWNGTSWTESPPAPTQQSASKERNIPGLIALILGIIGFIFACIPGELIIGWVLLPIAFILGVVGLLLSGKTRGTSIAAVIVSVVGVVVGATLFLVAVQDAFEDAFSQSKLSPSSHSGASSPPSGDASAPGGEGGVSNAGSRENPLPVGETVSSDDWEITLGTPY